MNQNLDPDIPGLCINGNQDLAIRVNTSNLFSIYLITDSFPKYNDLLILTATTRVGPAQD